MQCARHILQSLVYPQGQVCSSDGQIARLLAASYLSNSNELSDTWRFNLFDHIVQGFVVRLPARLLPLPQLGSGVLLSAIIPGDETKRSNLFVTAELQGDSWFLDAWEMGEQLPSGSNWVEFSIPSKDQTPLVHIGLSSEDMAVIEQQQGSLNELWSRLTEMADVSKSELVFQVYGGQDNTYAGIVRSGGLGTHDQRVRTYYCPLGTIDHEAGTMPYGIMLDNKGRLQGGEQIRVVGPASFPRMGAANPSLTTIAIARRTAALIG